MTPYEQMVSATLRIEWLLGEGIPAPSDIGVTFFYQRSVLVAKGETVDAEHKARLGLFWDILAYSYFE